MTKAGAFSWKVNIERAIADLSEAISLNPERGASFLARAIAYMNTGMDTEAANDLKTAVTDSETALQGFVDSMHSWRTQFDKVLSVVNKESQPYTAVLTDEEIDKLNGWIGELRES